MTKGFLALNGILAVALLFFAYQIWLSVVRRSPTARAPTRASAASAAPARPPAETPAEPRAPLPSYAVVAAKSLFNPARTEDAAGAGPSQIGPRPFLYGVVVGDDLSIAYLEDPGSKRVSGYRIGDAIAGGTLAAIKPDHVVLKRADGMIDVQLRDPAKPRAAVPEAAVPPALQPAMQPAGPGVLPRPPMPNPVAGVPPQLPLAPAVPGAFPQPPTLLRRLPAPPVPVTPGASPDVPDR